MRTALVTAIGSFSGSIVLKTLKTSGFRTVACDLHPGAWLANCALADVFVQAPPALCKEAYLSFLRKLCIRERVDFLLPLTDAEIDVLNDNRPWFAAHGVCLCLSPAQTVALCRDKYRLACFAAERGLAEIIPTARFADFTPASSSFPLLCKPVNGRSSQGIRILQNDRDWAYTAETVEPERYIVQPYLSGEVVTVDVVRQPDGARMIAVPRRELIRTPNGAGISVQVFSDAALEAQCARLADALGVVGCVNFEFLRGTDGVYRLLECNPRFSGGAEFTVLAGYDCVHSHMQCFMGEEIEPKSAIRPVYLARRYEAYITEAVRQQEEVPR